MVAVGIVVPTIYSRPEYLPLSLSSLRKNENVFILLACPANSGVTSRAIFENLRHRDLFDAVIFDTPGDSLAAKINKAIGSLPQEIKYVGWLGDDDLLADGAADRAGLVLESNDDVIMTYGDCKYIDEGGRTLFVNRYGQFGARILGLGPQLIPQPGSVWRRDAFESIGQLSEDYQLAFDYDLFMKLRKLGEIRYIPDTQASFRWHLGSLSVRRRWASAVEASRVRRAHYRGLSRLMVALEPLTVFFTWVAGKIVTLVKLNPIRRSKAR